MFVGFISQMGCTSACDPNRASEDVQMCEVELGVYVRVEAEVDWAVADHSLTTYGWRVDAQVVGEPVCVVKIGVLVCNVYGVGETDPTGEDWSCDRGIVRPEDLFCRRHASHFQLAACALLDDHDPSDDLHSACQREDSVVLDALVYEHCEVLHVELVDPVDERELGHEPYVLVERALGHREHVCLSFSF